MDRKGLIVGAVGVSLMAGSAAAGPCYGGLVTVPDTSSDRVWGFWQTDGTLYRSGFIPYDGRMVRAKDAPCSRRDSVLVSDPGAGAILHYGFGGAYIATVTDEAASGIAEPRGMMVMGEGIYIAVGAGPWADTVQRIEFDGSGRTTWASTHLAGPMSILNIGESVYITNSGSGNIERFGLDGSWIGTVDSGLEGVEQVALGFNGGLLVATARGIRVYDAAGVLLGTHVEDYAVRGVFELTTGEVMFTTADSVRKVDLGTGAVTLLAGGGLFEYIQPVSFVPGPAGWTAMLCLAGPALARRRR